MRRHQSIVTLWFLASICTLIRIQALDYSDLEMIGFQNCPNKNSCAQMGNADYSERICECDSNCRYFGDCCVDAGRSSSRQASNQICMHYGNYTHQGVFVINRCPSTFVGSEEIRRQCQHDNFSDPLLSIPVTDTLNRKTYLNRYCALCNDASPTSLTTWIVSACKVFNQDSNDISWGDITFSSSVGKWGYERDGEFHSCGFMFDKPASVSEMVRRCRSNIVSSCPRTWTRQTYKRACDSYMSVVTDASNVAYRNPHCAICNGASIGEIMCISTFIFERKSKPFSFALLLDVNRSDGDIVGVSTHCSYNEKYDPFFKKCRQLTCALPGYTMVNGRCVRG